MFLIFSQKEKVCNVYCGKSGKVSGMHCGKLEESRGDNCIVPLWKTQVDGITAVLTNKL